MAVILNPDAQVVFFTKVLGANHPVIAKVKALVSAGITFEVSLYAVRAYVDGKKPAISPVQLTFGTTALMKGTADSVVAHHNQKLIVDWVSYLWEKQGKPVVSSPVAKAPVVTHPVPAPTSVILTAMDGTAKIPLIKAVMNVKSCTLLLAKQVVDMVEQGHQQTVTSYATLEEANAVGHALKAAGGTVVLEAWNQLPTPISPVAQAVAKPVDEVVDLRHAQALGQKVHGTSSGSVYYCIAMSEHVRLAARMSKAGSISIRAEWTNNPTEDLAKLEEAGVQMKLASGYGSIHFSAEGVPLARTIGAFLMGTGINWTHVVTNGAELVVGS